MTATDLNAYLNKSKARKTMDDAAVQLRAKAGAVQAKIDELSEDSRAYAERALSQVSDLGRSALEKAKDRPALSALTVFGVGVALGAILALALRSPAERMTDSALDGAQRLRSKLKF